MNTCRRFVATVGVCLIAAFAIAQPAEAWRYWDEINCGGQTGTVGTWEQMVELHELGLLKSFKYWWLGSCNNWT